MGPAISCPTRLIPEQHKPELVASWQSPGGYRIALRAPVGRSVHSALIVAEGPTVEGSIPVVIPVNADVSSNNSKRLRSQCLCIASHANHVGTPEFVALQNFGTDQFSTVLRLMRELSGAAVQSDRSWLLMSSTA